MTLGPSIGFAHKAPAPAGVAPGTGAAAVARLAADRAAISKGTYSQGQTTIGQEFMNIYKNNCRMICKPFKNFKTKSVWLNMS